MLAPGDRIGDWIVVDVLGEGGMGAVYRCRNALSDRIEAAVKVVKPHSLKDETERFIREVEALDALRHPAVVGIKGWGQDPDRGLLWMAMDLVKGDDLEKHIDRGALEPEQARKVFAIVADAVRHGHKKGIYHRDIKPANIILDEDGRPWIVDFGIAVHKGRSRLTAMGMVPGTPAYMAPEIFSGDVRPDPVKLDVYALGQVLWEALTGQHAYPEGEDSLSTGQRLVQLMGKKLQADPLDPGPEFPEDLREAVRRSTDPEPDDRMPDMNAFYSALTGGAVRPDTEWVPTPGIVPDVPAKTPAKTKKATPGKAPKKAKTPPPPPESTPPRRRGLMGLAAVLGVGGVAVVGVFVVLVVVVAAISGVAALRASRTDTSGGVAVPPATTRDVRVVLTGIAAGTPAVVALDGVEGVRVDALTYAFGGVVLGEHQVSAATGACDLPEIGGACPACCACSDKRVTVVAGDGAQIVAVEAAPPPEAAPRPVRILAPNVTDPWNVFIDLGGASGPRGSRVDARTKDYASVQPGVYSLRVEAGRCPASARGCWPAGTCPSGCASWDAEVTIPCGTGRFDFAAELPTPQGKPPSPAPASLACRSSCPSGAWKGSNLSGGERVTVLAVHTEDAYCGYPGVVGVTGTVVGDLHVQDGCWMGGGLRGDDGVEYYFFKAAFQKAGGGAVPTTGDGRFTGATLPSGTVVKILDVHPADAYYGYRGELKGAMCETTGQLEAMETGWMAGPMYCPDFDMELWFFKVAVKR